MVEGDALLLAGHRRGVSAFEAARLAEIVVDGFVEGCLLPAGAARRLGAGKIGRGRAGAVVVGVGVAILLVGAAGAAAWLRKGSGLALVVDGEEEFEVRVGFRFLVCW